MGGGGGSGVEVGIEIVGESEGENWAVSGSSIPAAPEHEANTLARENSTTQVHRRYLEVFDIAICSSNPYQGAPSLGQSTGPA